MDIKYYNLCPYHYYYYYCIFISTIESEQKTIDMDDTAARKSRRITRKKIRENYRHRGDVRVYFNDYTIDLINVCLFFRIF